MTDKNDVLWIFGYGSLLWRPGFSYQRDYPVILHGWKRRLWQGSPDHRGTPVSPGRVVTILPDEKGTTAGLLYRVAAEQRERTIEYLDKRESGGYVRLWVRVELEGRGTIKALTYAALDGNPNFLGPAPHDAMRDQIESAQGESGENIEYCRLLHQSLHSLGVEANEMNDLFGKLEVCS